MEPSQVSDLLTTVYVVGVVVVIVGAPIVMGAVNGGSGVADADELMLYIITAIVVGFLWPLTISAAIVFAIVWFAFNALYSIGDKIGRRIHRD